MKYIKSFESNFTIYKDRSFKSGDIVYKIFELWLWSDAHNNYSTFNIDADKYIVFGVVGVLGRVINVQNLTTKEIEKNVLASKFISQDEYLKQREDYIFSKDTKNYNL